MKTQKDDKFIEYTEEELEKVAGGGVSRMQPKNTTVMCCAICCHTLTWEGNFHGQIHDCPNCKQRAFIGGDYRP